MIYDILFRLQIIKLYYYFYITYFDVYLQCKFKIQRHD